MKKNKLILFDWGGIVEPQEEGFVKAYKELYKQLGYDKDDLIEILVKYHTSSINNIKTYEEVFNKIIEELGIEVDFKTYLKLYNEHFMKIKYNREVAEYEASLKDKCYIGILSNLGIIDYDRLDKQLGVKNYDYLFLSYELECQKPNNEIYEKVQNKIPFNPQDVLFVDDLERNLVPARNIGWNTYLASGKELDKIKKACDEFINS